MCGQIPVIITDIFATIAFLLLRSVCRVITNLNFVNGGSIMPNFKRTQFCTHNQSHNLPSRYFGQGLIQLKELKYRLFTPTTIQIGVNGKFKKWLNQLVSSELENFLIHIWMFPGILVLHLSRSKFFYPDSRHMNLKSSGNHLSQAITFSMHTRQSS